MKLLTDKLLLLILCVIPFLFTEISSRLIAAMLLSVIAACVCQAGERNRNLKLAIEAAFGAAVFFIPEFGLLAALPLYEAVRTVDTAAIVLLTAGVLKSFLFYGTDYILIFAICGLAVYLSINTAAYEKQRRQLIKNRDDSAELERLLKRRNRELKEKLEYELRINTLNERNRIAREIHDNVGHTLSRSLLQTGALCAVCLKDQQAVKTGLEDLKATLNSAMESIRKSVHDIRDDSLDMQSELKKIVSALDIKFKTEVSYDIQEDMPPKLKLAFIAILKEAVSNIARHSNGDRVQIILREHPVLYQLIISDNGTGKVKENGMGIEDMRQRAEDIGAVFRITSDKAFTVFVSVRKV